MKILIAGDFCDTYRVSDIIAQKSYDKLFSSVKNIIKKTDYSFVNFEFPIVTKECKPISKCGPNLKGQPEAVEAIKYAGFNCCTLANNHILDQGEDCLLTTKNIIENAGIKTVGAGSNLSESLEVLYIKKDNQTLAVINCCEQEFSIATNVSAGANPLNPIQQYYKIQEARLKADYVLIIVHGGHENYQYPSPRMKETYRFFIDAGADAVVNHHQHCYSGYEVYKEKPIFYGLGNFLFDWNGVRNSIWNEGYMVIINFEKQLSFSLIPYIQCNDAPSVRLLEGVDKVRFESQIGMLNAIIANDEKLQYMHDKWIKGQYSTFRSLLCPYSNRLLVSAWYRGWLKRTIGRNKIIRWLNYINCESHRDILRFFLKNNL